MPTIHSVELVRLKAFHQQSETGKSIPFHPSDLPQNQDFHAEASRLEIARHFSVSFNSYWNKKG